MSFTANSRLVGRLFSGEGLNFGAESTLKRMNRRDTIHFLKTLLAPPGSCLKD